jgi:urease accessory protein
MNSDPATNTEGTPIPGAGAIADGLVPWLAGLLQSADSFYPTGSYAHSFGLEGLVSEGAVYDRATLRQYLLLSVLPSLGKTDLPIVAHTWRALADEDWTAISELSVLSSALKTAQEARVASENIGRQRAELAAALHPASVAVEYVRRVTSGSWPYSAPVAAGVEARVLGAPIDAALTSYAYASITSAVAAAMKLLRLGQNGSQTLISEMLGLTASIVTSAQIIPRNEIGWFNPWLDIAAARHESADARMFIS